ncbi:MAG: exopolyphosphatase [Planctomycetes bacterium]|nr:exopolyphosphatase [Planctomycetota bacterium]
MRIITRGDMDGLASSVLLTTVEKVGEIAFVHPKDAQDGRISATPDDILVNLPYVQGCGMWFDHHISEDEKAEKVKGFKGAYKVAPSAARVIHDYYQSPLFEPYKKMMDAIDRFDSGNLTMEDVTNPQDWILLAYTIDPRTGLGPEFQKYFRWLVEYVKEIPLDKVLEHREVKKRIDKVKSEQDEFKKLLQQHCRLDGNVVITDLRALTQVPTGNRFLVYTLFPQANVEARIFWGKGKQVVIIACGHSIFNRTCKVNLGKLLAEYGGGGHAGAGTCQIPVEKADKTIPELIKRLQG